MLGTTWQVIANLAAANKRHGRRPCCPKEGSTGWSDTWMVSSKAEHPNCMYMWMDYITSPDVQAQVAYYFGEAPANPKACDLITDDPTHCDVYKATDEAFYDGAPLLGHATQGVPRRQGERLRPVLRVDQGLDGDQGLTASRRVEGAGGRRPSSRRRPDVDGAARGTGGHGAPRGACDAPPVGRAWHDAHRRAGGVAAGRSTSARCGAVRHVALHASTTDGLVVEQRSALDNFQRDPRPSRSTATSRSAPSPSPRSVTVIDIAARPADRRSSWPRSPRPRWRGPAGRRWCSCRCGPATS